MTQNLLPSGFSRRGSDRVARVIRGVGEPARSVCARGGSFLRHATRDAGRPGSQSSRVAVGGGLDCTRLGVLGAPDAQDSHQSPRDQRVDRHPKQGEHFQARRVRSGIAEHAVERRN